MPRFFFSCLSGARSKKIDVTSRFLFPFVFALFNVAYWTTYLRQENDDFHTE
jgi:hypothetical protein